VLDVVAKGARVGNGKVYVDGSILSASHEDVGRECIAHLLISLGSLRSFQSPR
jgi:hypothetical protein